MIQLGANIIRIGGVDKLELRFDTIYVDDEFFNPQLKLRMKMKYSSGMEALTGGRGYLNYKSKIMGRFQLNAELPLPYSINATDNVSSKTNAEEYLFFECELNHKAIKFINDTRKNNKNGDVVFNLSINLFYLETAAQVINSANQQKVATPEKPKILYIDKGNTYLRTRDLKFLSEITIKASDWINDYAPKLGLGEYEVIEIKKFSKTVKPGVTGFEEILNKIDQANNKLLKSESPEDVLSDLRSAWDIFDKYHKDFLYEINKVIKDKSKKEDREPEKEERIESIRSAVKGYLESISKLKRSIDKLTQIGPHREIYHSTLEDAELAFRLTTSLIAYYSGLLSKIEKED